MIAHVPANLFRALAILALLHRIECQAETLPAQRMTQPQDLAREKTVRFHRTIAEGTLQDLQAALKEGAAPNAPGHVGQTALMVAMESKDLQKAKLLVQHGADPELTDDFNATSLRHAVGADFIEGIKYLLSLGVDRGQRPKYPLKKISYDAPWPETPLPEELKGVLSEEEWRESAEDSRKQYLESTENPTVEPMIADVQSVEALKMFLNAGDDLSQAPTEIKRELVGIKAADDLSVTSKDYHKHKSPSFGSRNPERMDFPFWKDMIRTGGSAYSARVKFDDTNPYDGSGAVWCYDRFGSSLTPLDDGRFVQIGGEHEDFYDPDFYIYNDVVIHDGKGNVEIYGYPRDVFPPTDFHSATIANDGIYVIGCLGYSEQRQPGFTPVYRLTLESWKIEPVKTTGEMPGWIHEHVANYDAKRNAIRISGGQLQKHADDGEPQLAPNEQDYELDLNQLQWRQVE